MMLTVRRLKRDAAYVSDLENQIDFLKGELRRLERSNNQEPNGEARLDVPENLERSASATRRHKSDQMSSRATESRTPIDDVSSLMWRLELADSGEKVFLGPSGNFALYGDVQEAITESAVSPTQTPKIRNTVVAMEASPDDSEDYITSHLLDLFEQFVNPIHFFLDHATLAEARRDDLDPEVTLVKYAAVAAGSLLSDDEGHRKFGDDAAEAVDATILPACRQYPSIPLVQALAIMCWRELGLEHHNMAWMYNSMCASMALHLGLPVISLKVLDQDGEQTTRTSSAQLTAAWSSILIDRIATSLLGRNCIIPWQRVKAVSYIEGIATDPTLEEVAFDYHCRLWFIHDQCMDQIYCFNFSELSESDKQKRLVYAREQLLAYSRNLDSRLSLVLYLLAAGADSCCGVATCFR
ncbi:hypothetical protein BJY04DRAFT_196780 [Aspergillus karnatakaensis]|uniref:fungal specific transcription factor domain-containing protein n=1 Tax=Aspergillus karnatakaensis TaxID=1810916 RepID=UPI003CCDFCA7